MNRALERIKEADAEIMVITLCYLGISAGYADSGNACFFKGVGGCD